MIGHFTVEVLRAEHDRSEFYCGNAALDRYVREQVTQDIRRRATGCYVAIETAATRIAGYYTLAASGIPLADLPPETARKLPRYPLVPVALLGRLAVDQTYRGKNSAPPCCGMPPSAPPVPNLWHSP